MPAAVPPPVHESTVSPPTRHFAGPGSSAHLGVRDDVGLQEAFIDAAITNDAQQDALTYARNLMSRPEDDGANPMFPEYRRNFLPAAPAGGSLSEEYVDPRNKDSVVVGPGTGLGNAYTPTIASPGEGHGIDPTALRSVQSKATLVLENGPTPLDNPADKTHMNTDKNNEVLTTGTVRKFRLGVGSGASMGSSMQTARGEFPRPPGA